jgi:hypothetical protein
MIVGKTESDHAALCSALIRKCASSSTYDYLGILGGALTGGKKDSPAVEAFCRTYVEALFEYIEEQINDKRLTLFLLKRFKHRCEWFRRADMLAKSKSDTRKGEKALAIDLYEYLHDRGIQFHIEARSASGEADLISSQIGEDRLVADVKIFNPEGGQNLGYLARGFRQVYDYTKDYNEPFGFLVIFKTCEADLAILLQGQEAAIPFITHNHKTIFFVVIDIFDYASPASKRGKLKTWDLKSQDLMRSLAAAETGPVAGSQNDPANTADQRGDGR